MGCKQSKQAFPTSHDPPKTVKKEGSSNQRESKAEKQQKHQSNSSKQQEQQQNHQNNQSKQQTLKSNHNKNHNNSGRELVKVKSSSLLSGSSNGSTTVNGNSSVARPKKPLEQSWTSLWESLYHKLLDPMDVPSVMASMMAQQTNRLSPTEITFLQRRVRYVVRGLPKPNSQSSTNKMMNRFIKELKNGETLEGRALIEKHHQLDEPTFRKVFGSNSNVISSLFVLGSHLSSDDLWERTHNIAVEAAKRAGVVMDVNKNPDNSKPPPPVTLKEFSSNEPFDVMGIHFSAMAYLVALALYGTRSQRLQLVFYLSLPAKNLSSFLNQHPAGGLPTWLLEADGDTVISLGSLAHYHHFGRTFGPRNLKPTLDRKKKITVRPKSVIEWTSQALLAASKDELEETIIAPLRRRDSNNHMRANSITLQNIKGDSPLMQFLQNNKPPPFDELTEFWDVSNDVQDDAWTMDQFVDWADVALSDEALSKLFYRLLGSGILPSPEIERELASRAWREWQTSDIRIANGEIGQVSKSVQNFYIGDDKGVFDKQQQPWGGIGGFDGKGGLGHGVMYCVDMKWWEKWTEYVGWTWDGHEVKVGRVRPSDLSTERLLDRKSDQVVAGTYGSFEVMKPSVVKGVDYVLVPPGVWDVLYEFYGGGPPLPRMVMPPVRLEERITSARDRTMSGDSKMMEADEVSMGNVEVIANDSRLLRIPEAMGVAAHPWVFSCHLCDASQPYRRGDAGPMSIRVMATPDQPLWRLYAEIIVRFQIQNSRAVDPDGRGRGRLWKRIDASKEQASRYGPWALLCKSRSAIWPIMNQKTELEDNYKPLKYDWMTYADNQTVEGCGLANGDRLMIEYAVLNKGGEFYWPREAAAKAGRMRRMQDEDVKFRRLLRGVDENENLLKDPPSLVGLSVDAMDASGRWYQVDILRSEKARVEPGEEEDDDEESEEMESMEGFGGAAPVNLNIRKRSGENKQVCVDFSEHGGHSEWILVDSDRLAVAGRFTLGKTEDNGATTEKKNATDSKAKTAAANKKAGNEVSDQPPSKICTLPGYGACGLANLGNTCYANSALQCISYMPLLRSYLLSGQYKATGDLNKDNPLGTGGKLLEEFVELLKVMWSGKVGERSPTRFRSQLGKQRSQFSGADQQDAQELLNYMLDVLHEDSNRVKKKPYVEAIEDEWVMKNSLPRVGEESWRRFLRRNQSVIVDVGMGQVMNTVTCPVCHFSSRIFDPFNLLSIPFPTVADVVFQCTVVRRATALNCPKVLNRPRRDANKTKRFEFEEDEDDVQPPSNKLVLEQYVIAMSRLADIGDLRLRLQNICGIPANRLRLCKAEDIVVSKEADEHSPIKKYTRVTMLPDKEGPCVHIAKSAGSSEEVGAALPSPTKIFAFENTLAVRPMTAEKEDNKEDKTDDEDETETEEDVDDEESSGNDRAQAAKESKRVRELLSLYGDKTECRMYDTDPLPISKAISRSLWPRTESEFKLGLRVDAIDHRDHWFPGSVVEIIEGVTNENGEASPNGENATKTKVRIHFDNFSSKWDETYTIDSFKRGHVRPLYSHATPRTKPTEFLVHHRYFSDKGNKAKALFGQAFFLQCHNEWSTARAGAHILSQTARYLQKANIDHSGPVNVDEVQETDNKVLRLYDKAYAAISELIDLLLECDRGYVRTALAVPESEKTDKEADQFRNPTFDATAMSTQLVKKVGSLLHRLPFELRVCTAEALIGNKTAPSAEEVSFPFSLMRTIGNYMNARHAVVLHWRDPPTEKKSSSRSSSSSSPPTASIVPAPVMYVKPDVAIHKASSALLEEGSRKSKNSPGSGGLHLGVCLTEFCKINQLHLNDNWRCPRCKEYREGKQNMNLWRLPDLLTFHIKRFNCSARWREKITTKVNFPLTGLDMSEWCHSDSPAMQRGVDSNIYDLIAVVNHYGGMTGGHYVATCKATACAPNGSEEVAYNFNGGSTCGSSSAAAEEDDSMASTSTGGWRLAVGRKDKETTNQHKLNAATAAKHVCESAEPLWLQFDDDLVEPIPPRNVVSEMAYVLFYRRRQMTPSNIAKYSSLE